MADTEEKSLKYPEGIDELYTDKCKNYRNKFNLRMRRFLNSRLNNFTSESEKAYMLSLVDEDNLIAPDEKSIKKLDLPIDFRGTAIVSGGKASLFVESPSDEYKEGFGKSSIMFKLLGIEIPYTEIPNSIEGIVNMKPLKLTHSNPSVKVLCSDMGYIGMASKSLNLITTKSEALVTQWDIVRHIFREKDKETYTAGKQRDDKEARAYLEVLGEMIHLDPDCFADTAKAYPIKQIFFMDKTAQAKEAKVEIQEKTLSSELLRKFLNDNANHGSTFWDINHEEREKRVAKIMGGLEESKLPKLYDVTITPTVEYFPSDEASKLISKYL